MKENPQAGETVCGFCGYIPKQCRPVKSSSVYFTSLRFPLSIVFFNN